MPPDTTVIDDAAATAATAGAPETPPVETPPAEAPAAAEEPAKLSDGADDDFEAAFKEFSVDAPPDGETKPAAEKPAAEEPAAPAAAEPTPEKPAAEEPAAAKPDAAPAGDDKPDTGTALLDAIKGLRDDLKPKDEKPAATEPEQPAAEEPAFTADEQAVISEYEKDFPDVRKAEALIRRNEYQQLYGYIMGQVMEQLKPVLEYVGEATNNAVVEAITSYHEDYAEIYDDVQGWVGEQKGARRKIFDEVIKSGTPEEVAEMISLYKEEKGLTKPAENNNVPASNSAELPSAAKQAASEMKPVSSKRTTPPASKPDQNDFEGSFKEFASQPD